MIATLLITLYLHQQPTNPFEAANDRVKLCSLEVVDCEDQKPIKASKSLQNTKASWYCLEGHKTANGERMHCDDLTFANKTLPFNTLKTFCYQGKCVSARLNDRGPFITGRDYDLSLGVFKALASPDRGVISVEVKNY